MTHTKPGYAKMLQTLYDHEISFRIVVQWDGGFEWSLGWDQGVNEKAFGNTRTAEECVEQLWSAALRKESEKTRVSLLDSLWRIK